MISALPTSDVSIACLIYSALPVTVASAERYFSKLKFTKKITCEIQLDKIVFPI